MNNCELVKKTILKESVGNIPYCIHFTYNGMLKHCEAVLKRYGNKKILDLRKKGLLTIEESIKLAIGNCIFMIDAPWWNWYSNDKSYEKDFDIPKSRLRTIGNGNFDNFFYKLELAKEINNCYTVATSFGSHIEKIQALRGMENSLVDFVADPERTKEILDIIIKKNIVMLENIAEVDCIDGILLGSDWGTQRDLLISPKIWREFIKVGEKKQYEVIKNGGKDVWVHSCGNIESIIPDLCDLGVDVLNPIQPECMDIYKLKENYGDILTFWGGISTQKTLISGVTNDVVIETKNVIEAMSRNGGYITAPSQSIQEDVPIENVFALIDTAKEYR